MRNNNNNEVPMLRWMFLLSLFFLLSACDSPIDKARPAASLLNSSKQGQLTIKPEMPTFSPLTAKELLKESIPVARFETTEEALSVWRGAKDLHPALLLFSNNPHLQPIPEKLRRQAADLISNADPAQLAMETTDRSSNPLLLAGMAVDAALRNSWFSELIWCYPRMETAQGLDLQQFKEQFITAGFADKREADTLSLTDETFSGTLRGVPFIATDLASVEPFKQPVIVHIDLGYFQPLYKNEVSTPLLDLVYKTLTTIKSKQLQVLAVTFSYGHIDDKISLGVRFVGDIISYLVEDPARLDQSMPINWRRQRDALYLDNFFQKEQIRGLFLKQELDAPNEAWIKYNLYRSVKSLKEEGLAMDYLEQAVALDPVYAIEYLELSALAYNQNDPNDARTLLDHAARAFPEDVFIELQLAQLDNETGKADEALKRLEKLRRLPWSTTYYAQVPEYLEELKATVKSDTFVPGTQAPLPQRQGGTSQTIKETSQPTPKRVLHAR